MSSNAFGRGGLLGLNDLGVSALAPRPGALLADALARNRLVETPDQYLRRLLAREAVDTSFYSPVGLAQAHIEPVIRSWAGEKLLGISRSGSNAKGTANNSGTDLDIFISLSRETTETLREVFNKLDRYLTVSGYKTRRQNVSVNITVLGVSVDLVPGKLQGGLLGDHSLYRRKADTWTKTNIATHITHVANSLRTEEMRIVKLWRDQKGLEFPSFALELAVMDALGGAFGATYFDLANNVFRVLAYLRDYIESVSLWDPSNTNNRISDDMTAAEKLAIKNAAIRSLSAKTWGQIVV